MKNRKILYPLFLFILLIFTANVNGQSVDLSTVNINELSDEQILNFISKAQLKGVAPENIEKEAVSRGLSKENAELLKQRISKINAENNKKSNQEVGRKYNKPEDSPLPGINSFSAQNSVKKSIFGSELFSNKNLSFEPNLNIATPKNYQLGPNDEVNIDIFGLNEDNYKLKVSPDGNIRIPLIGPVSVGGLTMEQATELITKRLTTIYGGIREGKTSVIVTLGNIRSIKVTLLGEVTQPGSYTLPSLATIFNALYASGGPSENGSFRNIQLIRNNKVIVTLDIYDFLLKGEQKSNFRLEDQDIIKVNPYLVRVGIFGEVKRNGLFEMMGNESVKDLIQFAGGFTEQAYTQVIKVLKKDKKERSIATISDSLFKSYRPKNGDTYLVEKILDRYSNRITLSGAVFRPGFYELKDNQTLSEVIKEAEGPRGDAFLERGFIKRTREDYTTEIISFNLKNIISGKDKDILLTKEDEITIPSTLDLQEPFKVRIDGEVLKPGEYTYSQNMSLEDLIIMSGGLKDAASLSIVEVSRRIRKMDNPDEKNTAQIFTINLKELGKNQSESKFILEPFDIVFIRKSPSYYVQQTATVEGEIIYPGSYTIASKNTRISDIINRAGGLSPQAFPQGAILVRKPSKNKTQEEVSNQRLTEIARNLSDSTKFLALNPPNPSQELIGIELKKILKRPGSKYDLLVNDGDILSIPKVLQTVKIGGEVLFPVSTRFTGKSGARKYISSAGGFTENAKRNKLYVVYPNGSVRGTRNFILFKCYPKVLPGSEIIVPKKVPGRKLSAQEVMGLSTASASFALIIITLSNIIRNK